LTERFKAIVK
jgi:hypothetical protein